MLNKPDRRSDKRRAKVGNRRGGFWSMLIEPYKQVKLSLMILGLNVVFAVIISAVIFYFVDDIFQINMGYLAPADDLTSDQKQVIYGKYLGPIFICLGLVAAFLCITFVIIIRYTHQIYGPLVSIHKYLDDMLEGKAGPVLQVRSSDQLVSLSHKLTKLSRSMTDDASSTEQSS
ncbi:MAG: hypothetical protein OXC44_00620 [Proteobacteria bacterium]|nr:hypothetical protein [Pseudomonadota bacterium]